MKRKVVLKKYAIHILPVPAIRIDAFEYPMEKNALISCTERTNSFLSGNTIPYKLVLPFPDVDFADYPGAFNGAHAREIIKFIRGLPECVTDLYVCCSKGGSRSTALAATILRASGRKDSAVWKNPFYTPNKLVYKRMCNELGFFTPGLIVRLKSLDNEIQFKKAQKRGNAGKYERWQIL